MKTTNFIIDSVSDLISYLKKRPVKDSERLLIQVFSGIIEKEFIEELIAYFTANYPLAHLIGATTDGEICEGSVSTHRCSISFAQFEKSTLHTAAALIENKDEFSLGEEIAGKLSHDNAKALILFGAGVNLDGEAILRGVQKINAEITVSGGMSADNSIFDKPLAFTKDGIISNGIVGASLEGDALTANGNYSFDWELIGKVMTVTHARGNRVYTLDNETAVSTYAKYLGDEMADNLPAAGSEFPLVITRNGVKVARAAMVKHDDGSLTLAGGIQTGDKVQFGFGSPEMILNPKESIFSSLCSKHVETIFIYSCMGRRRFMPDIIEQEIEPLASIAHVSGFFTYGEFYHHADRNELLNQTMTVLALSETSDKIEKPKTAHNKRVSEKNYTSTVKALSFFINSTLNEMEKLNSSLEEKVDKRTKELQALNASLGECVAKEIRDSREKDKILIQQSRNAAMGEMINAIAHQWRQPLNALALVVSNIKDAYEYGKIDEAYMQRAVEKSNRLIQKMSSTINDFRDFFKPNKMKTTIHLNKIIQECVTLMEGSLKNSGIEIKIEVSGDPTAYGFSNELSQALLNLISNAKDAIDSAGQKKAGSITISSWENEEKAFLQVEDTGGGIDDAVIEYIFDPYYTTKEQGKGTGIGLYMTKSIICDHMQGEISACNSESGARLLITLPKNNEKEGAL